MAGKDERAPLLPKVKEGRSSADPTVSQMEWRGRRSQYLMIFGIAALIGLILAITVNEILWYSAVGFETVDTGTTTVLKLLVVASTITGVIYLCLYYDAQINLLRCAGTEVTPGFNVISLWESRYLSAFIIDLLCVMPQPVPFVHFTVAVADLHYMEEPTIYTSDNILVAFMFLRITFLPRIIAEITLMGQDIAHVMAKFSHIQLDTWFVMRSLFIANFTTVVFLIGVAVFSIAYLILLCERPYPHVDDLSEYTNCLWLTIITITTVGYGDLVPQTTVGRVATILNACIGEQPRPPVSLTRPLSPSAPSSPSQPLAKKLHPYRSCHTPQPQSLKPGASYGEPSTRGPNSGVVFVSLIINGVVARVKMAPQEEKILEFVNRGEKRKAVKNAAALVMQKMFKQYMKNKVDRAAGKKTIVVAKHPRVRNVLISFRQSLAQLKQAQIDQAGEQFQSIMFMEAKVMELEQMIKEIHKSTVSK